MTGEKVSVYDEVLAAWTVTAWLTYEIFRLNPCQHMNTLDAITLS